MQVKGQIAVSLHGYVWAFEYNSNCSKLDAMSDADKFIQKNPGAEIVLALCNETMEGTSQ